MMKKLLCALVVMVFAFGSAQAFVYVQPSDTIKASKIAKKARKQETAGKTYKALTLYEQAAKMGLKSAQRWMADYYWNDVPPKPLSAMQWEEALAEQGDTASQVLVGLIYFGVYEETVDVAKDEAKGTRYKKMAAEQGNVFAQYSYGYMLVNGAAVEQNEREGFDWLKKAADQGDAVAQFYVDSCYYWGTGVTIDYEKAFQYTKMAAEQGEASAQYNLGHMFHFAEGVEKDLDEAIYWYSKVSEQRYDVAKNNLALAIEEKEGTSDEALFLLRKSADAGDEVAQYNLGCRYEDGSGVTQDLGMAKHWYSKSAENDYAPGQRQLGLLYLNPHCSSI